MFGIPKPVAYALAVLAAIGLLLGAIAFIRRDAAKDERERQALQIERDEAAQTERERAADQIRRDAEAVARVEAQWRTEEIDNATRNITDKAPSDRQRVRACLELRRQHAASGSRDPAPC